MYFDKGPWNISVILSVFFLILTVRYGYCVERLYYMAVIEQDWNYAPTGANHQNSNLQKKFGYYIKNSPNAIGGTYRKAMFRHYTDETFIQEWPQPTHMAITGPIIRAEMGDTLKIVFRNKAKRPYSFNAQGVSYLKDSEGALYVDGTSGSEKYDDFVRPGTTQTYIWTVLNETGPSMSDPCTPWVYRSHVNSPRDTNAGLVGVLLTCKKGTLNYDHTRNDVNTELVIFNKAFDENQSWYIGNDVNRCGTAAVCETLRGVGEVDFVNSNIMRSINGRGFSNLNGLTACAGDKVAWYFLTVGNEKDSNTMFIEGQIMDIKHTRSNTASVFPGAAAAGFMIPRNPGRYGVYSMAEDNFGAGVSAHLYVTNCFRPNASLPTPVKERNYFLSIEERGTWDYGPSGVDQMANIPLTQPGAPSALFFDPSNGLGGKYRKMEYVLYTNSTYSQKIERGPLEQHLGLLGPPIRVEEGETVNLMLRNKGNKKYSFVGQSLYHTPTDSGYSGGNTNGVLYPRFTHTFKFQVPENIVKADDPDCVVRLYYSANDFAGDVNSGLVGPLLICKRGSLNADNTPITFNREFFLLFKIFDESLTSLFQSNIREFALNQTVNENSARFKLSNQRSSINGYSYGNLPELQMCKGENVILHMMTLGNADDDVSVHFHGHTLDDRKTTRDTVGLISGMTKTMTMKPKTLGIWGIVSTIQEHYLMGMTGRYRVYSCPSQTPAPTPTPTPSPTKIRSYAIGAVEVDWNYAANGRDVFTGVDLNDPRSDANVYVKNDQSYIGSVYKKAVFRGFLDAEFKNQINRGFDVSHLGILGPVIKAEVGDNIHIYFRNLVNSTRRFSIQPHGVHLDKDNEEYYYEDTQRQQSLVGAGFNQTKIYKWSVPASSGPGANDPNCITWLYYSAIDKVRDVESGLIGPLQICRKGTLNDLDQRQDVNREFHVLFKKFNENQSWFLDKNILNSAPGRLGTDFLSDLSFEESNKMFSVNGESTGNLKGLAMLKGEFIAWNFYAIGDNDAFNTVRINGHTFIRLSERSVRADTLELFPGTSESVIMEAAAAGKWLISSDISTHVTKGMSATYQVVEPRTV